MENKAATQWPQICLPICLDRNLHKNNIHIASLAERDVAHLVETIYIKFQRIIFEINIISI